MNIDTPVPDMIRDARAAAGLTQAEAAEVVHLRSWKRWGEYENGKYGMPLATWELFLVKTGQHKLTIIKPTKA